MTTLVRRIAGAAALERRVYAEVSDDGSATWQALLVVVIVHVVSNLPTTAAGVMGGFRADPAYMPHPAYYIATNVLVILGWAVAAVATWFLAHKVLGGTGSFAGTMRALAFATVPHAFVFLVAAAPKVGAGASYVMAAWGFACAVVAVREAQRLSTGQAFMAVAATVFLSLILAFGLMAIVIAIAIGTFMPGGL